MRRVAAASQGTRPETKRLRSTEPAATSSGDDVAEPEEAVPVYGTMSVSGRSRHMEDAIYVRTRLCRPGVSRRRPVHFFSVYDGHGGPHVIETLN